MKTQDAQLSKNLGYTNRLLIGLIIALSFTLTAFEYTSIKVLKNSKLTSTIIDKDDLILPPITYRVEKIERPEPKTKSTDQMTIVDEIETKEIVKTIEVDPIDPYVDVNKIDWESLFSEEIIDEEELPITNAEVYANYGNCEGLIGSESYDCATQEIMKRIHDNFSIPEELQSESGLFKAFMQFVVDKEGHVIDIETIQSNHPALSKASVKAIESLPKMNPATQRGRPVKLLMRVPIALDMN